MSVSRSFEFSHLSADPKFNSDNHLFHKGIAFCQRQKFKEAKKCFKSHLLQNGHSQDICQMLSYCDFKSLEQCTINVCDLSDVKEEPKQCQNSSSNSNSVSPVFSSTIRKLNLHKDLSNSGGKASILNDYSSHRRKYPFSNQLIMEHESVDSNLANNNQISCLKNMENNFKVDFQLDELLIYCKQVEIILKKIDRKISSIEKEIRSITNMEDKCRYKYFKILQNLTEFSKRFSRMVSLEKESVRNQQNLHEINLKNSLLPKDSVFPNERSYISQEKLEPCLRPSIKRKLHFNECIGSKKVHYVFAAPDKPRISNDHSSSKQLSRSKISNAQSLVDWRGLNIFSENNLLGLFYEYGQIIKQLCSIFSVTVQLTSKSEQKQKVTLCLHFYNPYFLNAIHFGHGATCSSSNLNLPVKTYEPSFNRTVIDYNSDCVRSCIYKEDAKFQRVNHLVDHIELATKPITENMMNTTKSESEALVTSQPFTCRNFFPEGKVTVSSSPAVSASNSYIISQNISSDRDNSEEIDLHCVVDCQSNFTSNNNPFCANSFSNWQLDSKVCDVLDAAFCFPTQPLFSDLPNFVDSGTNTMTSQILVETPPFSHFPNIFRHYREPFICRTPFQLVHSTLANITMYKPALPAHYNIFYHKINKVSQYMMLNDTYRSLNVPFTFSVDHRYLTNFDLKNLFSFGHYIKFFDLNVYQIIPYLFHRSYFHQNNPVIKYLGQNLYFSERSSNCFCSATTKLPLTYPFCNCLLVHSLCADSYNYSLFSGPFQMRFVNFPSYVRAFRNSYYSSTNIRHQKFLLSSSCIANCI